MSKRSSRTYDETVDKISEAEYFLKKIKDLEKTGDDDEFVYNLNAFLHSWASIFDVMLEDYQRFYGLRLSMLDDLKIGTFRNNARGNETALNFIDEYEKAVTEFFGHKKHYKVLELLESPIRVDEFVMFLLNRINWTLTHLGFHDCYIALYNVIQDILGWKMDYHQLIMQPVIMQRHKIGFDREFVDELFTKANLHGWNLNLEEIFDQEFLRKQVIRKQELTYDKTGEIWEDMQRRIQKINVKTPIYTIAGLLKKKRHTKTHRRSSELMGTIQHFAGDKLLDKSRMMNFLKENYVNEEQRMVFGHFNTPIHTVETCEDMLERTKIFVDGFQKNFPLE